MKFNSQIATSRVQSKRLIALGLKKETADIIKETTEVKNGVTTTSVDYSWSLHRLIEMMPENVTLDDWLAVSFDDVSYYHGAGEGMIGWKYYKAGTNLYDCLIECYEWLIKEGYFNKEYLEE